MTTHDLCEVIVTAPDRDWLIDLCRQLVDTELAASAHVIHPVTSIYRWDSVIHETTEARAFLRSRRDLLEELVQFVVNATPTRFPTSPPCRSSAAIPTTSSGSGPKPHPARNRPHGQRRAGRPSLPSVTLPQTIAVPPRAPSVQRTERERRSRERRRLRRTVAAPIRGGCCATA